MSTFARKPDESSELQAADPRLDLWFSQRGRRWDFSRMELEELVQALAARPHLWEHLVKHSTSERFYVQLHLDDTLEVWLICWSQQQDTGFHDHNGSRGAVAITDGSLEERRLALGGDHTFGRVRQRISVLVRPKPHPRRQSERCHRGHVDSRLLAPAG